MGDSRSYEQMIEKLRGADVLFSALFELTYDCNLDCFFCYNDLSRTGRAMDTADWCRALDELRALGALEVGLSGGEPMVHPGFFEIGRHASDLGMVVRVKTNGHLLDPARSRRMAREVRPFLLEISLHGADAATHERQTRVGGSFERLLRNLRHAREAGLRVQLKTPLTRWNERQLDEIVALVEELGVTIAFDTVVTPRDDGDLSPLTVAPSAAGVGRLQRLLAERAAASTPASAPASIPTSSTPTSSTPTSSTPTSSTPTSSTGRKNCGTGSTTLTVDPFGRVFPCVQWRRPLGDLHEQSLTDIWSRSPALSEVRRLNLEAGALHAGDSGFCLGLAEQRTGDPLGDYPRVEPGRDAAASRHDAGSRPLLPVFGQDVGRGVGRDVGRDAGRDVILRAV